MYLLDTNILIYHFNNSIPESSRPEINKIFQDYFNISIITYMEFLGFKGNTESSFTMSELFLEHANTCAITNDVVKTVIDLN